MYLRQKPSDDLVEILDLSALFDPFQRKVNGRLHAGEELQDPSDFAKNELVFPSGESLPRCWTDPQYREARQRA
ncbi:MAG: acetyltransferase [Pseudomonadota bacterium]|nr:MAG: acetyltransferase [Pseudomonadota bacterium]